MVFKLLYIMFEQAFNRVDLHACDVQHYYLSQVSAEVMFSLALILFVSSIIQKLLTDFDDIFRGGGICHREEMVSFWW